jgi:rRNA biogenesis protein RRP5
MAPVKRKGNTAEEAAARQPQKRVRVGAEERKNDQKKQKIKSTDDKPKPSPNENPKASELTVLRDDEASFPRGGASVLTPLERKQIHVQAAKDVLFEQKGPKKQSDDVGDDEEEEDVKMDDADDTAAAVKKPRKRKTKSKKNAEQPASEPQGVRIEGLNFKVRCSVLVYRIVKLTEAADCSWVYDFGSSLQHQRPRRRPLPPQQPHRLCSLNRHLKEPGRKD